MTTFKQTKEIINQSKVFQQFKQEHPNSKLCAGFFILDFLSNDTKKSLDYLDEGSEKVFTFNLNDNNETTLKEDKLICSPTDTQTNNSTPEANKTKLTPLLSSPIIEVDELKSIVGTRKLDEGIQAPLHKIIAVLQNYENQLIWNLTCMLDQLIILHVLVNAETREIIKFERKNMMDFIKKK